MEGGLSEFQLKMNAARQRAASDASAGRSAVGGGESRLRGGSPGSAPASTPIPIQNKHEGRPPTNGPPHHGNDTTSNSSPTFPLGKGGGGNKVFGSPSLQKGPPPPQTSSPHTQPRGTGPPPPLPSRTTAPPTAGAPAPGHETNPFLPNGAKGEGTGGLRSKAKMFEDHTKHNTNNNDPIPPLLPSREQTPQLSSLENEQTQSGRPSRDSLPDMSPQNQPLEQLKRKASAPAPSSSVSLKSGDGALAFNKPLSEPKFASLPSKSKALKDSEPQPSHPTLEIFERTSTGTTAAPPPVPVRNEVCVVTSPNAESAEHKNEPQETQDAKQEEVASEETGLTSMPSEPIKEDKSTVEEPGVEATLDVPTAEEPPPPPRSFWDDVPLTREPALSCVSLTFFNFDHSPLQQSKYERYVQKQRATPKNGSRRPPSRNKLHRTGEAKTAGGLDSSLFDPRAGAKERIVTPDFSHTLMLEEAPQVDSPSIQSPDHAHRRRTTSTRSPRANMVNPQHGGSPLATSDPSRPSPLLSGLPRAGSVVASGSDSGSMLRSSLGGPRIGQLGGSMIMAPPGGGGMLRLDKAALGNVKLRHNTNTQPTEHGGDRGGSPESGSRLKSGLSSCSAAFAPQAKDEGGSPIRNDNRKVRMTGKGGLLTKVMTEGHLRSHRSRSSTSPAPVRIPPKSPNEGKKEKQKEKDTEVSSSSDSPKETRSSRFSPSRLRKSKNSDEKKSAGKEKKSNKEQALPENNNSNSDNKNNNTNNKEEGSQPPWMKEVNARKGLVKT
ncbi:hypothetical protein QOT17_012093 [Balamuthia mandrillaris]